MTADDRLTRRCACRVLKQSDTGLSVNAKAPCKPVMGQVRGVTLVKAKTAGEAASTAGSAALQSSDTRLASETAVHNVVTTMVE